MKKISQLSFNRYFSYFIVITCVLPSLYFYASATYLAYPYTTFGIVFIGYLSFTLGFRLRSRQPKTPLLRDCSVRGPSRIGSQILLTLFMLLVMVFVFLPLRYKYNIGVPNYPPSIKYTGLIYYLSTYGIQAILIAAFFLTKRRVKNFYVLIFGLVCYALYEARLGWRIGLLEAIIILSVCRYYIQRVDSTKIARGQGNILLTKTITIVLILVFLYTSYSAIVYLQMVVRSPGSTYVLDQIVTRFWAANYLDNTISYFLDRGYGLLTNGNHFLFLFLNDVSVAEFNNAVIAGTKIGDHHGNAKSGFGSVYIFAGLLGVVTAYMAAGVYFSIIQNMAFRSASIFWTTLCLMHFPILFRITNEQFELGTFTTVFGVWIFACLGTAFAKVFFMIRPFRYNKVSLTAAQT